VQFAAGTVEDDDELSFSATAPTWDADALDDAITALRESSHLWEFFQIAGAIDSAAFDVAAAQLAAMHAAGLHHWAMGGFRLPAAGETEEDYLSAFVAAFGASADTSTVVCAGGVKVLSSLARRRYRRPLTAVAAALASSLSEELDLAAIDTGRLPVTQIRDANGNPDEHDESIRPGLDDARALTARTWVGETGVYINNPRILSPLGSDFDFLQKRRVMNLGRGIINAFMRRRLSKPLRVGKNGFVRESELVSIEAAVNQLLAKALLAKPKASSARLVLSRTDAILAPPYPLTGRFRMQPLAYPKEIDIEVGWTVQQTEES
jgi:hypothetical protein